MSRNRTRRPLEQSIRRPEPVRRAGEETDVEVYDEDDELDVQAPALEIVIDPEQLDFEALIRLEQDQTAQGLFSWLCDYTNVDPERLRRLKLPEIEQLGAQIKAAMDKAMRPSPKSRKRSSRR